LQQKQVTEVAIEFNQFLAAASGGRIQRRGFFTVFPGLWNRSAWRAVFIQMIEIDGIDRRS